MNLIVGLGNPGPAYLKNRHNVGFMMVDQLAEEGRKRFEQSIRLSLTCAVDCFGQRLILAKPQTFMNLSGRAVQELLEHYSLDPSRLLVIYDDLALPLGTIRIRPAGSSGGHKGMESIIQVLGTAEVPRLRVGILQGEAPLDYSAYVLSDFMKREIEVLEEVFDRSSQAINTIFLDGLERAMSLYN